MNLTNLLLVAGEIAAPAGVDEKLRAIRLDRAVLPRFHRHIVRVQREAGDVDALADFRAGLRRVLEQEMIKVRAFNLIGGRLARELAPAEDQLEHLGTVPDVELRAPLFQQPGGFQLGEHAHLLEDDAVVGQQRFADVKARKNFLLQHEHRAPGLAEKRRRRAAARPAANHDCVIHCFHHAPIQREIRRPLKRDLSVDGDFARAAAWCLEVTAFPLHSAPDDSFRIA